MGSDDENKGIDIVDSSKTGEVIDFIGKLFKKAGRGVGGFVKRAAPVLKNVARVAAPVAGVTAAVLLARRRRGRRG